MNFLDNLSIKAKLMLLLFFPVLGIIYFSSGHMIDAYSKLSQMEKIEKVAILSTKISALVHETQKERGMTAGYLGSKGKKFADKLPSQRDLSNKRFNELKQYITTIDFGNYPSSFKKRMDQAVSKFENIDPIRTKVDTFNIEAKAAIGYYTKMNGELLDNVVAIAKLSKDAEITQQITAYSSFLLSKERAGIERAVGANTLGRDSYAEGMRTKLNDLISAQSSYMKTFLYYATDDAKKFYETTLQGKAVEEVNRIRKILLSANEMGGFGVNAEYWFDTITKKIGLLKKVENHIRDTLRLNDQKLKEAVVIASKISNLLHETQKERGATAGFIGSQGKKFVTKLPNQRKLTDSKIAELKSALSNFNVKDYTPLLSKRLNKALNNLKDIENIRKEVSSLNITAKKAIGYYTGMNASFLDFIETVAKSSTNVKESRDLTAFYNFLMAKERAGIERAVGSNSFARNKFLPGMKEKLIKLITEQQSFTRSFIASARPSIIDYYEKTVQGKSVDEVQRMRDIALGATSIGGFGVEATYWFEQITKKINKLKEIDDNLAKELAQNVDDIKSSNFNSMLIVLIISIGMLAIVGFMAIIIPKRILSALRQFQAGLGFFFQYAIREKDYLKPMDVKGNDEFAQMTKDMNEQIKKTEYIIEQDKKVVNEIDNIMGKVINGFFGYTIKNIGATHEVESLRRNINDMLADTKRKLDNVNKQLKYFSKGEFNFELSKHDLKGMSGDIGSLVSSSKLLGRNVSELMATISLAGEKLNNNTSILSGSSKSLSTASNEQASSLEETAAAIEEITGNIRHSAENVANMSVLADEVNNAATVGEKLASKTAESMGAINTEVSSISDAITVIDQIAFQTNILSLNAAVEAATAGEAGKGFAVVAGEVRNLAARSAEAAREIKELVESASSKANEGKAIADEMIDGYHNLNTKIIETKSMIDMVSTSSKEQEIGMVQINDAVNALDKVTQENASTASNIDTLTNEVNILSNRLIEVTKTATFDEKIKNQVCDIQLNNIISGYKNDHINFKDTNFAKLDTFTSWKVTDCKSCNLGKWILECESKGKDFVSSSAWSDLKKTHEHVHAGVQQFVDKNASRASNEELEKIAESIESDTVKVFDDLNALLEVHCNTQKSLTQNSAIVQSKSKQVTVQKSTFEPAPKHSYEKKTAISSDLSGEDEWESF